MTLVLYDAPRCPYCARVRIVLAEKGIPHEVVEVDLDDRPTWIRRKNPPSGRVPVIEDGELVLPESVVINELLEELHSEPALLPSDPVARAFVRLRIERFDELGNPYYAARRGTHGALGDLAVVLEGLERELPDTPWLGGDAYGLADIAFVPWVLRAEHVLGIPLSVLPALTKWLERCLARPAVAAEAAIVATLPRLV